MTFQRPLSPSERSHASTGISANPFSLSSINQFIVEGEGVLDLPRWQQAVAIATSANPGARLKLHGHLQWSHWIDDGAAPEVIAVNSDWDGMSGENAPFLDQPLDLRKGPLTQVILVNGSTPRVIFRTHHATMDGTATRYFISDVFRALRHEQPVGASSTMCEMDILSRFNTPRTVNLLENILTPTGNSDTGTLGMSWQRIRLDQRIRSSLAKTLLTLAAICHARGEGNVRFRITIDLRRHDGSFRSTANLTSLMFVDIGRDMSERELVNLMRDKLKAAHETWYSPALTKTKWIPRRAINAILAKGGKSCHTTNRYATTGTVSSIGEMEPGDYEGGGFVGRRAFAVPIKGYSNSVFVTLWGCAGGLDLCLGMPVALASGGRLTDLCEQVRTGVTTSRR